jgi:uncharacterized protein (DUF1800 family)
MGDQNTPLSESEARHLLRRATFGARPADVQDLVGVTRGDAADQLLAFGTKAFKPSGKYIEDAHNKWVKYMIKTKFPLQEKLVLFWHDHFATSNAKVDNPKSMARQNQLLRANAAGDFKALVKAINRNAAMIEFLDTVRNHKDIPNENYARELQELFTLGVKDPNGNPNYTQQDIVQIARAFTGWDYEYNSGNAVFHDYDHDYASEFENERGPKVIYQSTGGFGSGGRDFTSGGEGAAEIDTVIDIIFDHTHRDTPMGPAKKTVARRTARRLLEYFAHPNPDQTVVDAVVTASAFESTWSIAALVRAIFSHDAFYASGAPAPFGAATKKSVKWPADYVVGTLRLIGMKLKSRYQYVDGGSYSTIRDQLTNMGQTLLEPPSVFGWDWETAWVSSATLLARYGFARDVTSARGAGASAFRPDKLMDLSLTDPGDIVDAVTDALGVTDQVTGGERSTFVDYLGGPSAILHLDDYDTRNIKLHGLFALVMQSPAYQLH